MVVEWLRRRVAWRAVHLMQAIVLEQRTDGAKAFAAPRAVHSHRITCTTHSKSAAPTRAIKSNPMMIGACPLRFAVRL